MATKYGAGAYTGQCPIGPSKDYVSPLGISEHSAQEHPASLEDLTKLLKEAPGSGKCLWIPDGVTMEVPNTVWGQTIKGGFILAGNLARIKWNYYGPTPASVGYMIPMFNVQEGAAISGVVFEGAGGFGKYGQNAGPCGLRLSGQKRTIIENSDLSAFRGGGVWFGDGAATITRWDDDAQRNILRHVKISHIQQYGFGYGCGLQGARQSFLIEASILEDCRHLTMSSGGTTSAYEVRYCLLGEAVYANSNTGPARIQSHQVDVHGGGTTNPSYRAGKYLWIHHNDFTANNTFSEKPNVCIRGRMADGGWALIELNWTKKKHGSEPDGAYTDLETAGNNRICLMGEEEGAVWQGPKAFSAAGVTVKDNWYGPTAPPDDGNPQPVANIVPITLTAPPVAVNTPYAVTATVENQGQAKGTKTVEIGWIPPSGDKVPLHEEPVTLEPGATADVKQEGQASHVGAYTFYCGDLRAVLEIKEESEANLAITKVEAMVEPDGDVAILVTVGNTGNLAGTGTVTLIGAANASQSVTVAPGGSQVATFTFRVGLN
jgi:hypothetical protein